MAGLQFRYDGYHKPERRGEMCFFPPRYNFPQERVEVPAREPEKEREVESLPEEEREAEFLPEETVKQNENVEPLWFKQQAKEKRGEADNPDLLQISEMLIKSLTTTEVKLTGLKGQVEFTKTFFDDLLYKLESFMQIMEIVKANEARRLNGSQAQVASLKTSKDSADEFLELLQGPVFQKVLRQFLLSVLVREDGVTNFEHRT